MDYKNFYHLIKNLVEQSRSSLCQNVTEVFQPYSGSSIPFFLLALSKMEGVPLVFIAEEESSAYQHYQDLLFLQKHCELPSLPIFLFPACLPNLFGIPDPLMVIDQLSCLVQMQKHPSFILITEAKALMEKIPPLTLLKKNAYEIKRNDLIEFSFLIELLQEWGYEKTENVTRPGQFAVRGGLIDVSSFAEKYPVRIRFFDNQVETLQLFHIATQRTFQTVETYFLLGNLTEAPREESLLNQISSNAFLLFNDWNALLEYWNRVTHRIHRIASEIQISIPHWSGEDLEKFCTSFRKIHLSPQGTSAQGSLLFINPPNFSGRIPVIQQTLKEWEREGYQIYVGVDSESQKQKYLSLIGNNEVEWLIPSLSSGFLSPQLKLVYLTGRELFKKNPQKRFRSTSQEPPLEELLSTLSEIKPGDYVVHEDHGIARFAGIKTIQRGNVKQDAIKLVFANDDELYVPMINLHKISKYKGTDTQAKPKLSELGSTEWHKKKERIKKRIQELAIDLVKLYAERQCVKGFAFPPDDEAMYLLESSFPYEETPDQLKAIEEVKADMEKPIPMDRLLCGDVGFGKTEVAIRAALKAISGGKQVAVLVPTTILAYQHYETFSERLTPLGVRISYLNRTKSRGQIKSDLEKLAKGEIDIIIGTHRLLSPDVRFKDLGLLIIDEEHKFGVVHKEKLRLLRVNVDTLSMTATPIPRTLHSALIGIKDISIISTPPPNRQPVETIIATFSIPLLREIIQAELERKGQVFFVHTRVSDLPYYAQLIQRTIPGVRVAILHGQMPPKQIEETLQAFILKAYDILVTTSIIESGMDIPNVNTIIIHNAHLFGLSNLHQLRGRVGRMDRKAYCYLLSPPLHEMNREARARLKALIEFNYLGSGFHIALRDLDIRGAGNLFGKEQSGFINEIGYELFQQIMREAIQEVKDRLLSSASDEEQATISSSFSCQVDAEIEAYIPYSYIESSRERLQFYQRLAQIQSEKELIEIQKEMIDRFGLLPEPILALCDIIRLRLYGDKLHLDKIVLKKSKLSLIYSQEGFQKWIQKVPLEAWLKGIADTGFPYKVEQTQKNLIITFQKVSSLKTAFLLLKQIDSRSIPQSFMK